MNPARVWDDPIPENLWDHPTFRKWHTETMQMLYDVQQAEGIVAQIDGRPARGAQLDIVSREEIRVILVDRPERLADE